MEHLTEETFKEKIFDFEHNKEWKYNDTLPCVIDFYAEWCGPCKALSPTLEELSKEYEGKVNFYKVDTEEEMNLSMLFKVRSIPTLVFVPVTGDPKVSVGAPPKKQLIERLKDIL